MWWSCATLTTVGYGDVYPVTAGGKVLGAVIAIIGVGMFALPTGILGAGFFEEIGKGDEDGEELDGPASREAMQDGTGARAAFCPHCGEKIG